MYSSKANMNVKRSWNSHLITVTYKHVIVHI